MPQTRLSSAFTSFHRVVQPIVMLTLLSAISCRAWFAGRSGVWIHDFLLAEAIFVLFCAVASGLWVYFVRLRDVAAGDSGLTVDDGLSTTSLRYTEIVSVQRQGRLLRVTAKPSSTDTTTSFRFIPRDDVAESFLRERVAAANAKDDAARGATPFR